MPCGGTPYVIRPPPRTAARTNSSRCWLLDWLLVRIRYLKAEGGSRPLSEEKVRAAVGLIDEMTVPRVEARTRPFSVGKGQCD